MRARIAIAVVFMLAGFAAFGFGLYPAYYRQPVNTTVLIIGIVVAVLGGIVYPSSGVETAIKTLIVNVAPYVPMIGGRRAADPPADPPKTDGS